MDDVIDRLLSLIDVHMSASGRVDLLVAAVFQGYRFRNNHPRTTPAASCTMCVEITNDRRKLGNGSLSLSSSSLFVRLLIAFRCWGKGFVMA